MHYVLKNRDFFLQNTILFVFLLTTSILGGAIELKRIPATEEEEEYPSTPGLYAFGYAAGRFPGNIDRTHSEVSDGSGVVRGSYECFLFITVLLLCLFVF